MVYDGALQIFAVVQMFVLGPRHILGVREYHVKLVAGSDAATSMASIVFQGHYGKRLPGVPHARVIIPNDVTDTNQRIAEIVIDENHLHLYWQARWQINDTKHDGSREAENISASSQKASSAPVKLLSSTEVAFCPYDCKLYKSYAPAECSVRIDGPRNPAMSDAIAIMVQRPMTMLKNHRFWIWWSKRAIAKVENGDDGDAFEDAILQEF
ncbi:hypothetical protein EDB19DRAFT_2026045 [Suillus lakei]|nr:hypothetical protein EDB19DRAFT_2026045 [Suillus lakei]